MIQRNPTGSLGVLSAGIILIFVVTIQANPVLTPGTWLNISPPGTYHPNPSGPPFGCMDVRFSPTDRSILYVTTDIQGLWKSTDAGANWAKIGESSLGSQPSPGIMQIDPDNPLHMYLVGGVRGTSLGFWVSNDGGNTWAIPSGFSSQASSSTSADVYWVSADPTDFNHLLLTFHGPWRNNSSSGVMESFDGGNTWTNHAPQGSWGSGHSVNFLTNSSTWLLGTQGNGFWRTTNSGSTWTQVTTQNMQHGGCGIYRAKTGVWYAGALNQIMRSTNNGVNWTLVGPSYPDGYYSIVSDGNYLYAQEANTGYNTGNFFNFGTPPGYMPYIVSPESDGITWAPYKGGVQTFRDGPYSMVFDSVNGIIYSANWNDGVWALKVEGFTSAENKVIRMQAGNNRPQAVISVSDPGKGLIVKTRQSVNHSSDGAFDIRGRNIIGKR